jgi:hypothetical protein
MLKSLHHCLPLLALIAAVCSLATVNAAEPRQDWSGVWGAYVEPGQAPFGRPGRGLDLPFTAEGKKRVDAYRSLVAAGSDSPGAHCLGSGMPESMMFSGGYPMEIIQRPEQITIIYEAHSEIRRLYFGDKVLPEADRVPGRSGYSVARWDGDTLIVESASLREQEDQMYPHSDQARIEERYHQETDAKGTRVLVAEMTLTDPLFYTQPVTAKKKWAFDPKGVLLPYECNEETWLDHLEKLKAKQSAARKAKG